MNDPKPAESAPPTNAAPMRAKRCANLRIPADMALYAALVGKTPEIDPALADPMVAVAEARRKHPWSPMVLSLYLRQICREKALKLNKPELANWLRKQSAIAHKRLGETQRRIHTARSGHAA